MTDERNRLERDFPRPMLDAVCERIRAASGELQIWAVLSEDTYETAFGDGKYLHIRGIALNEADAHRLAALADVEPVYKWHVRPYRLRLSDGLPTMLEAWPRAEEFRLDDVVEILGEILPAGATSKIPVGSVGEAGRSGPHMKRLD